MNRAKAAAPEYSPREPPPRPGATWNVQRGIWEWRGWIVPTDKTMIAYRDWAVESHKLNLIVKINEEARAGEGEYAGRELVGAVILRDLDQDGNEWSGGKITDPKNGKTYNVKMSLRDANTLDVRGFIKVPLMGSAIGRTQTWYRVTG